VLIAKNNNNELIIIESSKDPKTNLKKENILFEKVKKGIYNSVIRMWINNECLIKGLHKHNQYGWYRKDIAKKLNIPVFKRITGGGVVYHDLGNLNWSFIIRTSSNYFSGKEIFERASSIIISILEKYKLEAYFSQPNRIEIEGYKISGMAARISGEALLVHGTLLINTDLKRLNLLCIPPPNCPPVQNVSFWKHITIDDIIKLFIKQLRNTDLKKIFEFK
jgi:lipoate-protein ligase A